MDGLFYLLCFATAIFVAGCVIRSVLLGIIDAALWVQRVRYTAKANAAARRARRGLHVDSRVTGWSGARRG